MRRYLLPIAAYMLIALTINGQATAATPAAGKGAASEAKKVATLEALVHDSAARPVKDAVVLARPIAGTPALQPGRDTVDQIDKEFVPFVKVIVAGTSVSFPNKDNIRHQVYSFSPAKRFELPLYVGTPATPVVFDQPGIVTLGCNIHDWMAAYIYVADTPYHAITQADGKARLTGLPAGEYVLQVWHPRMDGTEAANAKPLRIGGDAKTAWTIKLKPDLRPRRAPGHHGGGYR
jgi:plastocyanin